MSGFKKALVSISSEDYQRLHDAEVRLRGVERESPRVLEQVRHDSVERVWTDLNDLQRRQQDFSQSVSHTQDLVRRFEQDLSRSMVENQSRVAEAVQSSAGQLWRNMQTLVAESENRTNAWLADEQAFRQQQFDSLQEQVAALSNHQTSMQDLALSWVEAAVAVGDFIQQNYDYAFFAPGQVERFSRELTLANQNINRGASEAGLSVAQQSYLHFSDLRIELEQRDAEWKLWSNVAREEAEKLYAAIQNSRTVRAMDMEGHEVEVDIDVNAWTGRKLDGLLKLCAQVLDRINSGIPNVTAQDLYDIVDQQLPVLRQKLEKIVLEARMAVLSSQVRINIADMVVQALEEQGFDLKTAEYSGGDQRNDYGARVMSLDGSEVVINVVPVSKTPGRNELQIHSLDKEMRSEHELRQRAKEIAASLQKHGLAVGNIQMANDGGLNTTTGSSNLIEPPDASRGQQTRRGAHRK